MYGLLLLAAGFGAVIGQYTTPSYSVDWEWITCQDLLDGVDLGDGVTIDLSYQTFNPIIPFEDQAGFTFTTALTVFFMKAVAIYSAVDPSYGQEISQVDFRLRSAQDPPAVYIPHFMLNPKFGNFIVFGDRIDSADVNVRITPRYGVNDTYTCFPANQVSQLKWSN